MKVKLISIGLFLTQRFIIFLCFANTFCCKQNNNKFRIIPETDNSIHQTARSVTDSANSNNVILNQEHYCYFTDLSLLYNYKIKINKLANDSNESEITRIAILIYMKNSNDLVDSLSTESENLLLGVFEECNDVRSYFTAKNTSSEVRDNNYGDLIIEDFNFDNLEDIAIIYENGSYSGSRYLFFIQSAKGRFIKNEYLSSKVQFYPSKMNRKKMTLSTNSVTSKCTITEWTYQYNTRKSLWNLLRTKDFNICD